MILSPYLSLLFYFQPIYFRSDADPPSFFSLIGKSSAPHIALPLEIKSLLAILN